jgi:hypothetical protein
MKHKEKNGESSEKKMVHYPDVLQSSHQKPQFPDRSNIELKTLKRVRGRSSSGRLPA